jgi:hypothetical protein
MTSPPFATVQEAFLYCRDDGRVKARFVDPDFRHRMGIEDILTALAKPD